MTLLIPPERYEIESSRLNWHLDRLSGVPGLPNGIAIMPTARSHAAVSVADAVREWEDANCSTRLGQCGRKVACRGGDV